jgi:hypothetical protein
MSTLETAVTKRDIRSNVQCSSTYNTRASTVFCCKREGHEGDHRGSGKQWNATGKVKITEKCP